MLEGFRVLEICDESGVLAGRILADLGADVVKLEAPGGDRAARRGPFLDAIEDPERSLVWLAANASKRGITLDCAQSEGRAILARLLGRFDVLLETFEPGTLDSWGFDADTLARLHPRLVRCAITPFGQTGPYAMHRAGDFMLAAMAGAAPSDVDAAGPGLAPPDAYQLAALEAALGIVLALLGRESSGRGDLVDVSLYECRRSARAHGGDAVVAHGFGPGARPEGRCRAPRVGEHNRDVYRDAGISEAELSRLVAAGVI